MHKNILLITTGSVAICKVPELIKQLKEHSGNITCVLTKSATEFISPLLFASLTGNPVYTDLFSLKDESEMGHIRLAREADLVAVVPATADILAKMVNGLADDLATTLLLATTTPVLVAPAMNVRMWEHKATQRNIKQLQEDGIHMVGPVNGQMACGESGMGRMAEPDAIAAAIWEILK